MTPTAVSTASATSSAASASAPAPDRKPWYRFGIVWLVIGGPLVVVVASLVTGFIAWRGADEVLIETPSARIVPTTRPTSETPAMTARNHAATAAPAGDGR